MAAAARFGIGIEDGQVVANTAKGKAKAARKSPAKRASKGKALVGGQCKGLQVGVTVAIGMAIPLLSLALSTIAGTAAQHECTGLAIGAFLVGATVLVVSLSHLAWAIGDITHSAPWQSWALAVAVDCSIALCEACNVWGSDLALHGLTTTVLVGVTAASMALNVYAFLRHR